MPEAAVQPTAIAKKRKKKDKKKDKKAVAA